MKKIVLAIQILSKIWGWVKSKKATWEYLEKKVTPLVKRAEEMAVDGLIDQAERKALVMEAIGVLEKEKKIKLNRFTRWLVSKVVDKVASSMPDIVIAKETKKIMGSK